VVVGSATILLPAISALPGSVVTWLQRVRPGGGPELIADVTVPPVFGLDGVVKDSVSSS